MGPLFGILAATVALSIAYLVGHAKAQSRGRAWRQAAERVGLTDLVTSDFLGIERGITGRIGMLRVTLERYQRGRDERGTRIVIDGLGHPSYEFALRREGVGSAIEKAFGEREIEVGDPVFDQRAYIHGTPRVVHAVLGHEARRLVGELVDGRIPVGPSGETLKARVSVSDGALRAEIRERAFQPGGRHLPEALETLLVAARRLTLPDDVPARLAENVRADPLAEVRLSNLNTLTRDFPEYEATRSALRAAAQDEDEEVRLRAAMALGEEGHAVLGKIAVSVTVADGRSARAVSALEGHLSPEETRGILETALTAGRRATARAAVAVLGQAGGPEVVPALAAALEAEDDELVVSAARALGSARDPAAETSLVAALDRHGPAVWPALAEALGRVGTAAAVAPLRTMASRYPFDLGLRRAARQAIAEIQSRLTGATPGQLTLADGDAGQLSLAEEGSQGRVSLARESEDATEEEIQWPTDKKTDEEPPPVVDGDEPASGPPARPPGRRDTE